MPKFRTFHEGVTTKAFTVIALASSIQNPSSFMSLWSLINQLQMLMLLLLTNIFIPLEVTNCIIGPKVALIPFDYIPFKSFSLSSKINEIFGFDQINTNIVEIGLESGSSFVNNFSLLCFLICIIALHFMLNIIVCCFKRCNSSRIISKIIKAPNFIVKKLLIILTFHYYIRTFLESSLTLQVSSISEIYYFSTGSRAKRSSLVCAVLVLILLISFLFVSFFLSITIKIEEGISNVLEELFRGLKNHCRFRFYTPIVITRRFIFILLLIIYAPVSPFYASCILCIVQLIYTILISIMRPFESRKDNLIEIINELFFLVFLCWICASYSKTNWTLTQSNTFIFLILSNNFILLIIVLISSIISVLTKIRNFCKKSNTVSPNTNENNNSKISTFITNNRPSTYIEESKSIVDESRIHFTFKRNK